MALTPDGDVAAGRVHAPGYQRRDHEVVDYQQFELPGTGLSFRGPPPACLEPGRYFACIGAAQTFGCFCEQPYPNLLADALELPALNLGYGGAGPAFFLSQPDVLAAVNRARFAVVQVMSARSESNSRFESGGLEFVRRVRDGKQLGAAAAWRAELDGELLLPGVRARPVRWAARRFGRLRTRALVRETRRHWIEHYRLLAERIEVPTVLLWFSKRTPRYPASYKNLRALFAEFPQLVDDAMIDAIRGSFDRYAECVTSRGSPQPLYSRFTGQPVAVDPSNDRPDLGGTLLTHNDYYPSPEMQEDAAAALLPICRAWR